MPHVQPEKERMALFIYEIVQYLFLVLSLHCFLKQRFSASFNFLIVSTFPTFLLCKIAKSSQNFSHGVEKQYLKSLNYSPKCSNLSWNFHFQHFEHNTLKLWNNCWFIAKFCKRRWETILKKFNDLPKCSKLSWNFRFRTCVYDSILIR